MIATEDHDHPGSDPDRATRHAVSAALRSQRRWLSGKAILLLPDCRSDRRRWRTRRDMGNSWSENPFA